MNSNFKCKNLQVGGKRKKSHHWLRHKIDARAMLGGREKGKKPFISVVQIFAEIFSGFNYFVYGASLSTNLSTCASLILCKTSNNFIGQSQQDGSDKLCCSHSLCSYHVFFQEPKSPFYERPDTGSRR